MRLAKIISVAWIFLAMYTPEQDAILNQKVSLNYRQTGIETIIKELQQQYEIRFSYINNEIPSHIKVDIRMEEQPLYLALDEMLKETSLSYQVVSGQVILKQGLKNARRKETLPPPADTKDDSQPAKNRMVVLPADKPINSYGQANSAHEPKAVVKKESLATASIGGKAIVVRPLSRQRVPNYAMEHEVEVLPDTQPDPVRQYKQPANSKKQQSEGGGLKDKLQEGGERVGVGLHTLFQKMPGTDENDYERKSFHLGIIYPLSTNGTEAGKYVNEISLHWMVGYAAGLDGAEFSGFGNIENDFVHGVQGAGFFNLVKNEVEGAQFAGFTNLNGGYLQGAQFAGFLNTTAGDLNGVQGAGFLNIATGHTDGAQLSGFMNIAAGDAKALQSSGFANITTGDMQGAQFSGFLNYSGDVNVQMSGFANVALGEVKGLQASGFINMAKNVKGVQLGMLNLADSVSGVPIGFLSIVRKNGYRRLEVWGGETLQANAAFKIGVDKFYNIFAFGSQFASEDFRWGLGYGVGTEIGLSSRDFLNLELISYQIREGDDQWIIDDLNLLNTLRVAYAHQFSEHFSLFVAPTFNVMVSQRQTNSDGSIGSNIAPWIIFDETYDNRTNVQMWPGFHAGIRF